MLRHYSELQHSIVLYIWLGLQEPIAFIYAVFVQSFVTSLNGLSSCVPVAKSTSLSPKSSIESGSDRCASVRDQTIQSANITPLHTVVFHSQVLMIQGFLVARKNSERLVQLVKMMSKSNYPCFKARDGTVKAMEKRFALNLTEAQSVQEVLRLISDSLDAWRTRQYDYYQRILNGIL